MTQAQMLGAFLRAHRERLTPVSLGLPATKRRRTPGLRREELAERCGVSATWYTWIEQGRPVSFSAHALGRMAAALRLSPAEREYLFELAGSHDPEKAEGRTASLPVDLEDWVHTMPMPAYVLDRQWNALAWNRSAAKLFHPWLVESGERNLLRFIFLNSAARELIVEWNDRARRVVAEFRSDAGRHLTEPPTARLVESLRESSTAFAKWWGEQDVRHRESSARRFRLRGGKFVTFTQVALTPSGCGDLKVVTLLPRSSARGKIRKSK